MHQFKPIGIIKSSVNQMSQGQWGNILSEIHIDDAYQTGLKGLSDFSHIMVIFLLDRAVFDAAKHLLRHPRGRNDIPQTGVFAQRTKYRPNPIGVSSVALLSIERCVLRVRGLDALDNTPVLDIKPYTPLFDRKDSVSIPAWVELYREGYF